MRYLILLVTLLALSTSSKAQCFGCIPFGGNLTTDTGYRKGHMKVDSVVRLVRYSGDSTKALFTDANGRLFLKTTLDTAFVNTLITDSVNTLGLPRVLAIEDTAYDKNITLRRGRIYANRGNFGDSSLLNNNPYQAAIFGGIDSLDPTFTSSRAAWVQTKIGYTGGDSVENRIMQTVISAPWVKSTNTTKWGRRTFDHPTQVAYLANPHVETGATGSMPYASSFWSNISGNGIFQYDRAYAFSSTTASGSNIRYYGAFYGNDLVNGTNAFGVYLVNGNEAYPPLGKWAFIDSTGYRSALRGELGLGCVTCTDLGDYKLQVYGKVVTTDLDEYNSNLALTYTARTKVDKNYVDSSTNANYVRLDGSYSDPSWITSLAYSKLTGTPTIPTISGTNNTITKFSSSSTIGNSSITDDGSLVTTASRLLVNKSATTPNSSLFNVSDIADFINNGAAVVRYVAVDDATAVNGALFTLMRTRGTVTSPTIALNGDVVGNITAQTSNGTNRFNVASIDFTMDGVSGTGDVPGRIDFFTTPDGTSTLTNRMTISNAGDLNVRKGITPNGGGLKHSRVSTGSISAGASALVTITWSTAFADANYTVTASVVDATTSNLSLSVVHIESISASAVTVRVYNSSVGSLTGTVHVIGMHD